MAGWAGVAVLPRRCTCVPPEAASSAEEDDLPRRGGPFFGQAFTSSCTAVLDPPNELSKPFPNALSSVRPTDTILWWISSSPRV